MQNGKGLTIRQRLTLGFALVLTMMVAVTIIGIQKVHFIDKTLAEITDVNAVKQVAVLADDHGTNYTLRLPKPVLRMLMEDISGKPQITTTQS